jgi:phage terminase large subunit
LNTTNVFSKLLRAESRYVISQGGTSSSKTYSMLQLLYLIAFKKQGVHISVVSETLPHLKRGAMRDFFKILITDKLYSEKYHDKTNNIYMVGNSMIEFFSADSGDKVRGARRDYLFINECNNVSFETYNQLEVRTKNQIYLDYNPSHEFWVHEYLLKKEIEHTFIKSTYKDNPYLDANIVKSIESRRYTDINWWRVFGEGELGFSESLIFTHWRQIKNIPDGNVAYGLDFGYNHPTALIKVTEHDGRFYAEQLIYESHLTNQQLIERLKQLNINRSAEIFADYSRPESIREIYLAGFNIKDANKDVKKGIDSVKSKDLYIHEGSIDLIKELRSYSWKKDRNEKLLEEPVKTLDDGCDALRYCIHTWKEPQITFMKPKITTFGKRNTYT